MNDDPRPADPTPRHRDDGRSVYGYSGRILVVCPRCDGRAAVIQQPGHTPVSPYLMARPRRLVCANCGATDDRDASVLHLGGPQDPFFQQPLWLQTRCVGEILWAYDEEHVDDLDAYVRAKLREVGFRRTRKGMFSRLPRWMKTSGNREAVLAGLERLRAQARLHSPADRSDTAHGHVGRRLPCGCVRH